MLDVQWVLEAITCVVRDYALDDHTTKYERMRAIDQEAIRKDKAAWEALTKGGATLSRSLLRILWQQPAFAERHDALLALMLRVGLAVPLPNRPRL